MPDPTPTPEQIVSVRKAAGLSSRAEAESLIAKLNDAEWEEVKAQAAKWIALEGRSEIDSKVKINPTEKQARIRHIIRTMLGVPVFGEEELGAGYGSSCAVPVETFF